MHEVYKFVNLFPFLIDPEALKRMVDNENRQNLQYTREGGKVAYEGESSESSGLEDD